MDATFVSRKNKLTHHRKSTGLLKNVCKKIVESHIRTRPLYSVANSKIRTFLRFYLIATRFIRTGGALVLRRPRNFLHPHAPHTHPKVCNLTEFFLADRQLPIQRLRFPSDLASPLPRYDTIRWRRSLHPQTGRNPPHVLSYVEDP